MIAMGASAPTARPSGETPSGKKRWSIDWPAGFGALAITVNPPPVTALASTAYFSASVKPGTSVTSDGCIVVEGGKDRRAEKQREFVKRFGTGSIGIIHFI